MRLRRRKQTGQEEAVKAAFRQVAQQGYAAGLVAGRADAWDEGYEAGWGDALRLNDPTFTAPTPNAYR